LVKAGLLHIGDSILVVNGHDVHTPEEFQEKWKSDESVTLKIVTPAKNAQSLPCGKYVRSMFDYDPTSDSELQCKNIGLPFKTGDIVQVICDEDDKFWQARKCNDLTKVGMIPSKKLQESRTTGHGEENKKFAFSLLRRKAPEPEPGRLEVAYEEVSKMSPYGRRVLVLLGAPGVGRRTLKSMLLAHDSANFATVTPYTSRSRREGEQEGREYHFVKRDIIQKDVDRGAYVEWGEYNNNLYGTSVQSVRDIIRTGRVCILDCSPQAARYLYNKEFMPYVVFVAPPSLEELKQLYQVHPNRTKTKADAELAKTCEESAKLESQFRSLVDVVLINRNVDVTFRRLIDALESLKTEPQWIPSAWLH